MAEKLRDWLFEHGFGEGLAFYSAWLGLALAVILLAVIANYVAKKVLLVGIAFVVKKSETKWDDALLRRKVFSRLSHLAPASVIYFSATVFGAAQDTVERFSMVYMIFAGLLVLNSFLDALVDIYRSYDVARQKPVKGYVQVVKIIAFVLVGVIALATLMNRSPWLLLSGFGALTAVLLLIFKDSILGLVASVQLSSNDMVRIGDWVEMPSYGADGDVIDVTLHTVKVQNWDKTITTIPSYALISDSFKNWRGMSESGGRRIKRAVHIDMNSIKFCTMEMLDRFEKYELIADYVRSRRKETADYNREHNTDTSELVNGRNLTNIGTFRAYMAAYLRNHPKIHQDMTFLIRHLQPGELGLPIEIYVFSNDQEWANYEAIQADIFDHILAVIPTFELLVFQHPTGRDFQRLSMSGQES
jgi:miniconductance mechanosensitive channel